MKNMGFGDNFVSYIECIFKNNYSTIISSGVKELQFSIERGVRQGDGVSALLFLIGLQPLVTAIKNDQRIKGVQVGDVNIKMELLADDTTVYIRNENEVKVILEILTEYKKASGMTINEDKSEILWLGKTPKTTTVGIIKTKKSIKCLGVRFSNDPNVTKELNYKEIFEKVNGLCLKFSNYNYDLFQKVYTLNTYILSQIWYVTKVIFPPKWFIEQIKNKKRNSYFYLG
jgi:hypothetical protein